MSTEPLTIDISLNGPQTQVFDAFQDGSTVNMAFGRGIGKSWALRTLGWYLPVAHFENVLRSNALDPLRGVRIVHIMPTFKACKDVHGDLTDAELASWGKWGWLRARIDHTTWRIRFPGGSWIQWFGMREANAARGIRCDIVTADEADDIDPGVLDSVVTPWFSEAWSLKRMLIGGTPRRGRYGLLYRMHEAGAVKKLPQHYSFHATFRDAPETVDPAYVESKRATMDPAIFKREWECDFDSAEGLVYPMFDARPGIGHVREPDQRTRWTEFLVGIDHGYEDPGVLLLAGVQGSGKDAVVWLLDEVYQTQQTETWWIDAAKKLAKKHNLKTRENPQGEPTRWFADPSRPDRIDAFGKAGIRVEQANNKRELGVDAVADRLVMRIDPGDTNGKGVDVRRTARMYVSAKCKETNAEFAKYRRRRDPKNPDKILDAIEDGNDHCFAAGTLVTTDKGDVPIEDIRPGMRVLTREGYYPVKAAGMTREAVETWTLDVRVDGAVRKDVLRATGDHLFWVERSVVEMQQRSWLSLRALRYGHGLTSLERNGDTGEVWGTEGRTDVECVRPSGIVEPVYDLTVDGPPEFFAGGILAHNCLDSARYLVVSRFGGPDRSRYESGPGWGAPP